MYITGDSKYFDSRFHQFGWDTGTLPQYINEGIGYISSGNTTIHQSGKWEKEAAKILNSLSGITKTNSFSH